MVLKMGHKKCLNAFNQPYKMESLRLDKDTKALMTRFKEAEEELALHMAIEQLVIRINC